MVYLKTYNEVALLFKGEASDVLRGMPAYKDEPERMIAVTINGICFINVYCVNGEAIRAQIPIPTSLVFCLTPICTHPNATV